MKILNQFYRYRIKEVKAPKCFHRNLCGAFQIPLNDTCVRVFADNGINEKDWEHVSVSLPDRCPTWSEMCEIKKLFFDDNETVVQFHPPKAEYVNFHPYCLHLWRYKHTYPLPKSCYPLKQCDALKLKSGHMAYIFADYGIEQMWTHYCVSGLDRYLTWDEICEVKDSLFADTETAMQFHFGNQDCPHIDSDCLHLYTYKGKLPKPNPLSVL